MSRTIRLIFFFRAIVQPILNKEIINNKIKSCIRKIKSNCKKEQSITFKVLYDVTKIDFFCSTKDKMPTLNQSFVVYEFVCPGCNADYVGKNGRTLFERNVEHA